MNVKYNNVCLRPLFLSHVLAGVFVCLVYFYFHFFSFASATPPPLATVHSIVRNTRSHRSFDVWPSIFVYFTIKIILIWTITFLDQLISCLFVPFFLLLLLRVRVFTLLSIGVRFFFSACVCVCFVVSSILFEFLFVCYAYISVPLLHITLVHLCVRFFLFNSLIFVMFPFNWLNACGSTIQRRHRFVWHAMTIRRQYTCTSYKYCNVLITWRTTAITITKTTATYNNNNNNNTQTDPHKATLRVDEKR